MVNDGEWIEKYKCSLKWTEICQDKLDIVVVVVVVVIFYYSDMGEDCYIVTCYKKVTARLPRP